MLESNSDIKAHESCKICGTPAKYKNFGIYTCFPCKVFFKRNAEKSQKSFKCSSNGHCPIDIHQRRLCACCRLEKCFLNGMRTDFLRASRTRQTPIHRHELTTPEIESASMPIVGWKKGKSLMNFDQWMLLTNLIHYYDQTKLYGIAQRSVDAEAIGTVNLILMNEFLKEMYQISSKYLCSNTDCYNLSSEDRSGLLRSAIENLTCLGWALMRIQSPIFHCPSFCDHLEQLYDKGSLLITEKLIELLGPDTVLIKLVISLFAFSNNSLAFSPNQSIESTNPMAILKIENTYAELTWKYLLYKYGQMDAILRFNKLIQCLLVATVSISKAQDLQMHHNLIDYIVEKTELSLILDDIERL